MMDPVSKNRKKIVSYLDYGIFIFYSIFAYAHLVFRKIFPPPLKSLVDEVALVTGSSNGIGRELVIQLAKYHPKTTLVLWDIDEVANKSLKEFAQEFGPRVFTYKVDVSNRNQVVEAAAKVRQEVGDVSILFNNAGVANLGKFLTSPPEKIEKTIQINLLSHFWTLRAFLPNMIEKNHGHIITTASIASFKTFKNGAAYCATKHGIRGYLDSLINELRDHPSKTNNIQFTTIFPWFAKTNMTDGFRIKFRISLLNQWMGIVDAKYVAQEIIKGMRQNQEKVFIPKFMELHTLTSSLLPRKLNEKLEDILLEEFNFQDDDD